MIEHLQSGLADIGRLAQRIAQNEYAQIFGRACLLAALRTAFFKQLIHGHLVGMVLTEGLMAFATSSNVGYRGRSHHVRRFDAVWALGAMLGVSVGLIMTHLVYHPEDGVNPWKWQVPAGGLVQFMFGFIFAP